MANFPLFSADFFHPYALFQLRSGNTEGRPRDLHVSRLESVSESVSESHNTMPLRLSRASFVRKMFAPSTMSGEVGLPVSESRKLFQFPFRGELDNPDELEADVVDGVTDRGGTVLSLRGPARMLSIPRDTCSDSIVTFPSSHRPTIFLVKPPPSRGRFFGRFARFRPILVKNGQNRHEIGAF